MAKLQDVINNDGLITNVNSKFSKLITNDYVVTTIQTNIQNAIQDVSKKLKQGQDIKCTAYYSGDVAVSAGGVLKFQDVLFDPYNIWDQTGTFTIPSDGNYLLGVNLELSGSGTTDINLYINGSIETAIYSSSLGSNNYTSFSCQGKFSTGDKIFLSTTGNVTIGGSSVGIKSQLYLRW